MLAPLAPPPMPRLTPLRILLISASQFFALPLHAQQGLPVWTLVQEIRVGSINGSDALAALGPVTVSPRDW